MRARRSSSSCSTSTRPRPPAGCRSTPTAAVWPTANRSARRGCGRCARSCCNCRAGRCAAGGRRAVGRFHPRLRRAGHQRLHRPDRLTECAMTSMAERPSTQWRAEVRAWLASVLPLRSGRGPTGRADYAVFQNISEDAERALLDRVRAYRRAALRRRLRRAGAAASRSAAPGCRCATSSRSPPRSRPSPRPQSTELISVTCGLVGPTIATSAPTSSARSTRGPFLRSDLLCCQLFSEPGAGLGPRRGGHPGGGRGRRLGDRRAEGVVVRRPLRRLRAAARAHRSGRRQAGRADDVPDADGRRRASRSARSGR